MRHHRRSYLACALPVAVLLAMAVNARAADPPTIINIGEGTVPAAAGQVEFQFVRHFIDETLEISVTRCQTFLEAALQTIRGSELQPIELHTSPPLITSFPERQTRAVITVRFGMAAFNAAKTGPLQFAALCDKLAELAKTMNATLSSPVLHAADRETIEATAVARATENAYPPADAIAQAVQSNIFAIDSVELLELTWNQQPENQKGEVPKLGCTARVRVTYALSAQ